MKSKCEHVWVKGRPPAFTEICMWCGIPKVRTSAPVPKLPMPRRVAEPRWHQIKSNELIRKPK